MNFNVYLDDETAKRLGALARRRGKARNALIREALEHLLDRSPAAQWPEEVAGFVGLSAVAPFQSHRAVLGEARDDPFAATR